MNFNYWLSISGTLLLLLVGSCCMNPQTNYLVSSYEDSNLETVLDIWKADSQIVTPDSVLVNLRKSKLVGTKVKSRANISTTKGDHVLESVRESPFVIYMYFENGDSAYIEALYYRDNNPGYEGNKIHLMIHHFSQSHKSLEYNRTYWGFDAWIDAKVIKGSFSKDNDVVVRSHLKSDIINIKFDRIFNARENVYACSDAGAPLISGG